MTDDTNAIEPPTRPQDTGSVVRRLEAILLVLHTRVEGRNATGSQQNIRTMS